METVKENTEQQQGIVLTKEAAQLIADTLGLFPAKDTYHALNAILNAPTVNITVQPQLENIPPVE